MSLTLWRMTQRKFLREAFSGEGAQLYGSRWSSPGVAVVFAAQSQALAVLEVLAHLDESDYLDTYALIPVEVNERQILTVDQSALVPGWQNDPPPRALRDIGDAWAAGGKSLALRVPSAIVPGESNFLLNPTHKEFKRLKVGDAETFRFDLRLGRMK